MQKFIKKNILSSALENFIKPSWKKEKKLTENLKFKSKTKSSLAI